jgi:type I restriction enzyme M protein
MGKKKVAVKNKTNGNGANLGFEAKLWLAADKLCNNMDSAEYKHVVLGRLFLKYISESFEEMYQRLREPKEVRWAHLIVSRVKQPMVGKLVYRPGIALVQPVN